MSNPLADICILLVKHFYGDVPSRVFAALTTRHEVLVAAIVQRTRLPIRYVQHGLAVLVQQNLVLFWPRDQSAPTRYQANLRWAYELLRAGKHVELVRRRVGSDAAAIIANVQCLGSATEDELARDVTGQTSDEGSNETQSAPGQHEETSDSSMALDESESEVVTGTDLVADESAVAGSPLSILRNMGYFERIGDFTYTPHLDFDKIVHDHILRTNREFRVTQDGKKKEAAIREAVDVAKLDILRRYATLDDVLHDFDLKYERQKMVRKSQAGKGSEKDNEAIPGAAAGEEVAPDPNKGHAREAATVDDAPGVTSATHRSDNTVSTAAWLEQKLRFRLNVSTLLVAYRSEMITDFARARIGENFAKVYNSYLRVLEPKIPWVRAQKSMPSWKNADAGDDEEYIEPATRDHLVSWPTTANVVDELDAETLVAMRMELETIYKDAHAVDDTVIIKVEDDMPNDDRMDVEDANTGTPNNVEDTVAGADENDLGNDSRTAASGASSAMRQEDEPNAATSKAQDGKASARSDVVGNRHSKGKRKAIDEPLDQRPKARNRKVNGVVAGGPTKNTSTHDTGANAETRAISEDNQPRHVANGKSSAADGTNATNERTVGLDGVNSDHEPAPVRPSAGSNKRKANKVIIEDDDSEAGPVQKKQRGQDTTTSKHKAKAKSTTLRPEDIEKAFQDEGAHVSGLDDGQDQLDTLSDYAIVNRYLSIIAQDPNGFLYEVAYKGSRQWNVQFDKLVEAIAQVEIARSVQERFGIKAVMVLAILKHKGQKLLEHQIADRALMNVKELRPILTHLVAANYILVQEVPKDNLRAPKTVVYLMYYNADRCRSFLLDDVYFSMSRLLQRLDAEKAKVQDIVDKAAQSAEQGQEDKLLTSRDKQKLARLATNEEKVFAQLARLDDLVMLWRDFLPPSVDGSFDFAADDSVKAGAV